MPEILQNITEDEKCKAGFRIIGIGDILGLQMSLTSVLEIELSRILEEEIDYCTDDSGYLNISQVTLKALDSFEQVLYEASGELEYDGTNLDIDGNDINDVLCEIENISAIELMLYEF